MTDIVSRKAAIGIIWDRAKRKSWTDEQLHKTIEDTRLTHTPSIRVMSPRELERILWRLFKVSKKVMEDPLVYRLRKLCREGGIHWSFVEDFVKEHWKNFPDITSIYHLDAAAMHVMRTKVIAYVIRKAEEKEEDE